ncbi:uncharacterized protein LOC119686867 [Teleopsis dalmanni]|uniref:uncharacterized protein LOC119686867 n=1 Tax=Teleopsis dalmanni TaxID=139649 RepID=UPI0018CF99C1|nr:uncharacterized protein LOC119686867 [Teleopsis dalmanni]
MSTKKRASSPQKNEELDKLLQQRETVVASILRIKKVISEKTVDLNPVELECRLDILNSYIKQAMTCQQKIECINEFDVFRPDLEEICVASKSLFLQALGKNRKSSIPDTSHECSNHRSRLPSMRLPKFSGKHSEYKNFISLFESLVHNDQSLSDIEKFNHLISCLSDEALGTVKAFQLTETNYSKALASLKRVYDNTCLIFFDSISQFFELPEMNKPSASALRNIIDTVSAIYESLLSIGDDKNISNAILIHLVMSRVDAATKSKWEEQLDYNKLPLWSDCETALNKRYQHISADEASTSRSRSNRPKQDNWQGKNVKSSLMCKKNSSQEESRCLFCNAKEHVINSCSAFAALSVTERFNFIKSSSACINCLKKGHTVSRCKASRCRVCNRSHHTLLHQYSTNTPQTGLSYNPEQPIISRASVNHSSSNDDQIILATAVITIQGKSGEYQLARALLDSGSQVNLITEELAQRLQLKKEAKTLNLIGIGETNSTVRQKLHATVRSRINSYEFSTDFWVMPSISTYQPDKFVSMSNWNVPSNLSLADPHFHKPQKIDLLLGAESFFELLSIGQIKQGTNLPILQKTLLGWIVSGKYKDVPSNVSKICNLIRLQEAESTGDFCLNSLVKKFWELEEIPKELTVKKYTIEQQHCETKFLNTILRLPSGRLKVQLPFKSNPNLLGQSYETAKNRFLSLERRLSKDCMLQKLYMEFMAEYRDLGHMTLTTDNFSSTPHYYIPHQCVLRPQSTSTKLRVVFDASCRTSSQVSLNDILMVGPTVQEELYSILLRFRMHKYAMTADITKMYRQIEVDEADRNFQLILWREKPTDQISVYKLNTVTYGTSPAPFLATRCLNYLSDLYKNSHSVGARVIRHDFYVDDLLTGADSLKELETIRTQCTEILDAAGLKLAKWFSNHKTYDSSDFFLNVNNSDSTKALGIHWIPQNDTLKFHVDEKFHDLRATKRNILSVSARLFDPLGLVCPIVTKAKILLQELWLQKLDWDESIPMHLDSSWQAFKSNLTQMDSISIPRYVHIHSNIKCDIHGFADASMRAYGCCIYVRIHDSNGIHSELLTAKSKVAPLSTKSLPRLELCAAHLLAKLWSRIQPLITCEIGDVYFWTDSEITLHWIKTHPSTLATFVANRVAEIQEWTSEVFWRHVPSKLNPADLVSRGCDVDELIHSIWFRGPSYLLQDATNWPKNSHFPLSTDEKSLEKRKVKVGLLAVEIETNVISKLICSQSSYPRLLRIFAYILRFITKKNERANALIPTSKELNWAFLKIVEFIQNHEFKEEIEKMKKSHKLPVSIQKLTPFIHTVQDGSRTCNLLRVGGRLLNAPLSYDSKFPLLLPKKLHFVEIYLRFLHTTNCHAGPKALEVLLREKIWVINSSKACSKTVRACIHCFRYKPKLLSQVMGNLPADRLKALRPFLISGVDFCGPVYTTLKIRGRPPVKMLEVPKSI